MACETSKRARVDYKFGNSVILSRNFVTDRVPISVEVKEYNLDVSGGQCPIQYDVTLFFGHGCSAAAQTGTTTVRVPNRVLGTEFRTYFPPHDGADQGSGAEADLRVYYQGGFRGGGSNIIFGCSGGIGRNRADYFSRITKIVPVNPAHLDNCGNLKKCQLIVRNTLSNTIIFKDEGECPCGYVVSCQSCPENVHCECTCGGSICCYDASGFPM